MNANYPRLSTVLLATALSVLGQLDPKLPNAPARTTSNDQAGGEQRPSPKLKLEYQDFVLADYLEWYCGPGGLQIEPSLKRSESVDESGTTKLSAASGNSLWGTGVVLEFATAASAGLEVRASCNWWTDAVAEGVPPEGTKPVESGVVYLCRLAHKKEVHVKFVLNVVVQGRQQILMGGLIAKDSPALLAAAQEEQFKGK